MFNKTVLVFDFNENVLFIEPNKIIIDFHYDKMRNKRFRQNFGHFSKAV